MSDLTSSPTSTSSTLSNLSTSTARPRASSSASISSSSRSIPRISQSPPRSGSNAEASSSGKQIQTQGSNTGRPSLLCPPATIVSPPSPVEPTTGSLSHVGYTTPPQTDPDGVDGSNEGKEGMGREEWGWDTPPRSVRRPSGEASRSDQSLSPALAADRDHISGGGALAATHLSQSPMFMSPSSRHLPLPDSPGIDQTPSTPLQHGSSRRNSLAVPSPHFDDPFSTSASSPLFASPSHSPATTPGLGPAPSSPYHYPKRIGHRRTSSTHRVRETPNGQQRNTEDGETMVNQYKIGKGLGKGGFAKVELAVDVGTGKEYAIKEFSQSRLHTQSLQEKQRLASRGRLWGRGRGLGRGRGRGRGGGPSDPESSSPSIPSREKRRCSLSGSEGEDGEDGDRGMGTGKAGDKEGGDPLGLIRREIAVMKKLDHPNIVHLYEAISVPTADALFLVLEYMPGGVLMSVHLGDEPASPPFEVGQAKEYFRQLVLGLEYLHANGVVHRDIKPDNILLSEDRSVVKLCDFGVSEMFVVEKSDDRIRKSGGSPAFLSPESFTSHTHEVHGKLVDIWALGVTLYCMLTGSLPFNTENPIELFEMVQNEEPRIPDEWPENQKDIVRQMLRKQPTHRIHMFILREHPWVTDDGANPMIARDDNLYHVGKFVEEPTQEELSSAIGTLRGVFTVIRAVQKMRRLQLARRSLTSSTASPPARNSTLDSVLSVDSNVFSGTSGSMDSYGSDMRTEDTEVSDGKGKKAEGEDGDVPTMDMDQGGGDEAEKSELTEREREKKGGAQRAMDKLRISTDTSRGSDGRQDPPTAADSPAEVQTSDSPMTNDEVQMVESPTEGDDEVQMVDSPVDEDEVQIMDSPGHAEEEEPVVSKIKGRPRPRPGGAIR